MAKFTISVRVLMPGWHGGQSLQAPLAGKATAMGTASVVVAWEFSCYEGFPSSGRVEVRARDREEQLSIA